MPMRDPKRDDLRAGRRGHFRGEDVLAEAQGLQGQHPEDRTGIGLRYIPQESVGVTGRVEVVCQNCRTSRQHQDFVRCSNCRVVLCAPMSAEAAADLPTRYTNVMSCWEHHLVDSPTCALAAASPTATESWLDRSIRRNARHGSRGDVRGQQDRSGRRGEASRPPRGQGSRSESRDSYSFPWGTGHSRDRSTRSWRGR